MFRIPWAGFSFAQQGSVSLSQKTPGVELEKTTQAFT
jgi:hypothetical protein